MKHYLNPDVHVRLRVDGEDLAEYDIDDLDDDVNTVTKYVEATAGANFVVYFSATPQCAKDPCDVVRMTVYLDGKRITGMIYTINGPSALGMGLYDHALEGVESNTATGKVLERFAFAQLLTSMYSRRMLGADVLTLTS